MKGEINLDILIANMKPILNQGEFVFCTQNTEKIDLDCIQFFFKEKEGLTVVCEKSYAEKMGFSYESVFSWLTLEVHSSLEAVGLTAAFSAALAQKGISCNVVAGAYHDHIFVPIGQAKAAILALETLSFEKSTAINKHPFAINLNINRIHHIAIICSNYEKSKAFYTKILGFKLESEVFRAERDSYKADLSLQGLYVIELFSFPNPPARTSRPEATGLRHLAFEVDNLLLTTQYLAEKNVFYERIRIDEFTGKSFTFIADPDDLPIEFYEK
jgi:glyoxylase I family protein